MGNNLISSHRLVATRGKRAGHPRWLNFRGHAEKVGVSPAGRVTVYVDPKLGAPALKNAQDLLADADRIMTLNDKIFGSVGGNVNVIVFALNGATDGTGGADHAACNFTTGQDIEVCAAFGESMRVSGLFEAELSECSMKNNLCGLSTGEALSRWCAAVACNNALSDFATGPSWVEQGMPNFVDTTEDTDQDEVSTGCGMIFLSWLQGPTGATGLPKQFDLSAIAQAMVSLGNNGTLAELYGNLTGGNASDAWAKFQAAVASLPHPITNDDPFGAAVFAGAK